MNKMHTGLLLLALTAFGPTLPSMAEAQASGPMYFGLGLGPSVGIGDGRGGARNNTTLFKLEQSFGFHILSHDPHPGLYLAAVATEGFRSHYVRLSFGLRAGYDIQVWTNGNLQLLASPNVTLGPSIHLFPGTDFNAYGAFNFGFAGDVRLVLPGGKLTVWARPFGFEFDANDGVAKWYDFMFGINLNF
jgi:hypothetical protein